MCRTQEQYQEKFAVIKYTGKTIQGINKQPSKPINRTQTTRVVTGERSCYSAQTENS
jgi:hypothetical protein